MTKPTSHSLVQTLRSIPGFSTLDETELLSIVGESVNLFWPAGAVIFKPGEPGDALFVILSGEISIRSEDGVEIARPGVGNFVGEKSLLLNATHSKHAVAVSDCELLVLSKGSFQRFVESNPKLAMHFEKMSARLTEPIGGRHS